MSKSDRIDFARSASAATAKAARLQPFQQPVRTAPMSNAPIRPSPWKFMDARGRFTRQVTDAEYESLKSSERLAYARQFSPSPTKKQPRR